MFAALLLVAAPVAIASKTHLLEFRYSWSAEAAAIPALDRRFRGDAAPERQSALKYAQEDRAARRELGTGNGHLFERDWQTAGQSARLLSIEAETGVYTGGAHPNSGTSSLLWDRKRNRQTSIDLLLRQAGAWDGAVRLPFCTLLDRERAKRREQTVRRGEWPNQCPVRKELTFTLEDKDRDARFDHVRVTADQYVAGSYAEGPYVISLPITATMIARLKAEYRASFEPQPPVQ